MRVLSQKGKTNIHSVGQPCEKVAQLAGIDIPKDTKIMVVEAEGTRLKDMLGGEKKAPVLAAYKYFTLEEDVNIARKIQEKDGKNHSISENMTYTHLMNVSRIARYMTDNHVPSDEELWN